MASEVIFYPGEDARFTFTATSGGSPVDFSAGVLSYSLLKKGTATDDSDKIDSTVATTTVTVDVPQADTETMGPGQWRLLVYWKPTGGRRQVIIDITFTLKSLN